MATGPVRNLWSDRPLVTKSYPIGGANVSASPANMPIELTQYAQEDVFDRIIVRVNGNVVVVGAGPGTATNKPNPHGLLSSMTLQTQPQYKSVIPVNNLSARSILADAKFARGYEDPTIGANQIPDVAGTYAVDFYYELYFKRPRVRKNVQYSLYLQKYTSALMQMVWGSREQLFTGGTNTWDVSGLSISVWADSDFAVTTTAIHASEIFEQNYVINASQTDFPIDTLPPGFLYTDLLLQTEVDGALSNAVLNNWDVEGGGRVWVRQGDSNAKFIQTRLTRPELTDPNTSIVGNYLLPLRDGMFSRAIDALTAPITIKLDVTKSGTTTNVRLLGRRMVPGGVQPFPTKKANAVQQR